MRLFVAIDIPKEIKDDFFQLQESINNSGAKLNLVKEFHVTLKFIGEIADDKVDELKEKLSEIKFNSFSLKIDKIGFFPGGDRVNVVWVGMQESRELKELHNQIENTLANAGLCPKDEKEFTSHITLARVKVVHDKKKFLEAFEKVSAQKEQFGVSSFKLIKSTLMADGPVYEEIERFPKPL